MDWNEVLPRDTRTTVTRNAVCLAALIGAGWALFSFGYTRGKDIPQDELAAYKAVSEARLPEITSGLLAVNEELRESLKVFDRNRVPEAENVANQKKLAEAVKTQADLKVAADEAAQKSEADIAKARAELNSKIVSLQNELQHAAGVEKQLRSEISKLTGDARRFTLGNNKAELLGEGHTVGLAGNAGMTRLNVIQDNKEYQMGAGSSISVELSERQCSLTLLSPTSPIRPRFPESSWQTRSP